jgi:hypothetical protein
MNPFTDEKVKYVLSSLESRRKKFENENKELRDKYDAIKCCGCCGNASDIDGNIRCQKDINYIKNMHFICDLWKSWMEKK